MRQRAGMALVLASLLAAGGAAAQTGDAAALAEMRRQLDEMRRRMEQLELQLARAQAAQPPPAVAVAPARPAPRPAPIAAAPPAAAQATQAAQRAEAAARDARAAAEEVQAAQRVATAPQLQSTVPGLLPPEPMNSQDATGDALRSDLPGIAFRVPGTDTQVRLYGFAKVSAWQDFNGRNQTDAPLPGGIPLNNSAADQQGGDFGMTARFSRFGVDTRSLTPWGTLETRIEGDFGGGSPTSSNAVFRLRQAFGEIGTERFRVLIGQANSLWNEGLYETLIDATNLNQSFIRQAQLRVTGRLGEGLVGQLSLEAPDTQYTSAAGVFTPGSSLDGGLSPAFNAAPDLLGRLTWRRDGLELGARALVRDLSIRTNGTAATGGDASALGWGVAGHARFPMRWLSEGFGQDELLGMAYTGAGIGRYFAGSTNGLDATSNVGLPGVTSVSLDPVPAWGVTAGYRRFWTQTLRSNFSYSYSHQDYQDYVLQFTPGSASATSLNTNIQQVFANLIWSPFAETRNGVFGSGWFDVGIEYLWTQREVFGGNAQTLPTGTSKGIANRVLVAAIARF
ncbi:DcaP family trimeric outer membrane transporter [Falsiroseomonas sp. HW251]|uniref:DcaP family trimeric outer membrane transporter n=1 Tax=Falsiroseomonas sp. HW251 TaxID=3390998 RepID=UPI003D316498